MVRVHEVFFGPPPHDAGQALTDPPPAAYLVMEWVEGPTLSELCGGRPASKHTIQDRLRYVSEAAAALTDLASYLEGTATVSKGMTLILAMRNLSTGDQQRYAQVVYGYGHASRLPHWRGAQFFGKQNQNVGDDYEVQLIALPLAQVRTWDEAPDSTSGAMKDGLLEKGPILDTIRVHRIDGKAPACSEH